MRVALSLIFIGLLFSVAMVRGEGSPEVQAIMELEARWSERFSGDDLEGVMALMAEEPVLIMPGSAPISGKEQIRAATEAMMASGDAVSWTSDFAYVAPSGDMAYDYGTATTRSPDGSVVTGHYLVVWVKEGGEWKVAADMFN